MGPRVGVNGCGKSRLPTGIRSPDRPARSELLYRLSYPGPHHRTVFFPYMFAVICCTNGVWDGSVVYVLDEQGNGAISRKEK